MSWDDVSYVIRSKARQKLLLALETARTPTLVAQEMHTSLANVSRTLRELESKGLIELITPEARVGKIFRTTDEGRAVSKRIRDMKRGAASGKD